MLFVPLFAPRLVSDGALYHEILRSLVIDGDLNFANEREFHTWRYVPVFAEYGVGEGFIDTGYPRHPFNIGAPLFWYAPFVVGHAAGTILELFHLDVADGYGFAERLATSITSLPLCLGGMLLTLRLLESWRRGSARAGDEEEVAIDATLAAPATLLVALAAPLPAFVLVAPTFSHALSYFLSVAFLVLAVETFGRPRNREQDVAIGLVLGLASLVRTQCGFLGVLFLLEPLRRRAVAGGLWPALRGLAPGYLRMAAAFVVAFSPQLASNLVIFGRLFLDPQGDAGMHWLEPQMRLMLWDGKHGLYATSPLLLLATLALPLLAARRRWLGTALLLAILVQFYLNGVRRDWAGVGFGMRRFVEVLPIFTIAFAELLWRLRRYPRAVAATAGLGLMAVVWNFMLMAQYYLTDLSNPGTWPTFAAIVHRNLEGARRLLPELVGRGLIATAIDDGGRQGLLEVGLFGAALVLLYFVLAAIEKSWSVLKELFPILVLALVVTLVTTDVFLIYSRLATRHVIAFSLDEAHVVTDELRARLPPRALALALAKQQGPDRIHLRRHLALRNDAPYLGLLGGFVLDGDRAGILTAEASYPGGFLDEAELHSEVHVAAAPRLLVDAAGLDAAGIDLVLSYDRFDDLPPVPLTIRVEGGGGELLLQVVKEEATLRLAGVAQDWSRPLDVAGSGGGVALRAPFTPRAVDRLVLEPAKGTRGLVVRGLALAVARPEGPGA